MDMTTTRKWIVCALMLGAVFLGRFTSHYQVVTPPVPAPIPSPDTTTVPPVLPVIEPKPVVVPVQPVVVDPVPIVDPIQNISIADFIAKLDQDWTLGENQTNAALLVAEKYQTLLGGVLTKHGHKPVNVVPVDPAPVPTPVPVVDPTPVVVPNVNPVVATGFRVIFVSDEKANMPPAQLAVLYSPFIKTYLDQKCAKSTAGLPEWRRWHLTTEFGVTTKESPTMVALFNVAKSLLTALPMVIISMDGKWNVYPLPANDAALQALLKQFGG